MKSEWRGGGDSWGARCEPTWRRWLRVSRGLLMLLRLAASTNPIVCWATTTTARGSNTGVDCIVGCSSDTIALRRRWAVLLLCGGRGSWLARGRGIVRTGIVICTWGIAATSHTGLLVPCTGWIYGGSGRTWNGGSSRSTGVTQGVYHGAIIFFMEFMNNWNTFGRIMDFRGAEV